MKELSRLELNEGAIAAAHAALHHTLKEEDLHPRVKRIVLDACDKLFDALMLVRKARDQQGNN
jgi:hypothetical protein